MILPEKVKYIINTFEQKGFEAYAVGGCVRDTLLGRTPEDWDVTTDASPAQIKALFRRTVDTGIAHGTVTVLLEKESFEVTTYRIDGDYEDSRHPKEVTFTKDLKEDLRRRDFTINAMAYNEKDGLVDCFGGKEDLKNGIIRCVGDAKERFSEDALRILRCVRFSAQLGFSIEKSTEEAAVRMAENLQNISAERIAAEWTKLLLSPHADRIMTAYRYGILKQFFPEITVTDRLVKAVEGIPLKDVEDEREDADHADSGNDFELSTIKKLRYGMLFCRLDVKEDCSDDPAGTAAAKGVERKVLKTALEDDARAALKITTADDARAVLAAKLLRRLKFDNDTIRTVSGLARYLHLHADSEAAAVRRAVHEAGEELFPLLFPVWRAYAGAGFEDGESLSHIEKVEKLYQKIIDDGDCLSLKTLAVDGSDLIALGIKPGRELGACLNRLLELVLEDPSRNQKEFLLDVIKNF